MAGFVIVKADMLVGLFGLGEDSFQLLKAGGATCGNIDGVVVLANFLF